MNFEKIVPPLELCKLIPPGEFENCCFAWNLEEFTGFACGQEKCEHFKQKKWDVIPCNRYRMNIRRKKGEEIYPAPTLQEIMEKCDHICAECNSTFSHEFGAWIIRDLQDDMMLDFTCDNHAPTAALKFYLTQKGIEVCQDTD